MNNIQTMVISTEAYLKEFLKYQNTVVDMYSELLVYLSKPLTYDDLNTVSKKCNDINSYIKKLDFIINPLKDLYETNIFTLLDNVNTGDMLLARPKFNVFFVKYIELCEKYRKLYDKYTLYKNNSLPKNMKFVVEQVVDSMGKKINYNFMYVATIVEHLQILSNNKYKDIKQITKLFTKD